MSAQVLAQTSHILALSGEEKDSLLGLLRQTLGEARVEAHRTHTPVFREFVLGQEVLIRNLIDKLERSDAEGGRAVPSSLTGVEEGRPVIDEIFIDEDGRFQMTAEDLEAFLGFLRDNEVHAEIDSADAVHSGGKTYGYGRLLHLFDAELAARLHRMWKQAREGRTACDLTA